MGGFPFPFLVAVAVAVANQLRVKWVSLTAGSGPADLCAPSVADDQDVLVPDRQIGGVNGERSDRLAHDRERPRPAREYEPS